MDSTRLKAFKDRQKKIVYFDSPEYKKAQEELRNELEMDAKWREYQDKDEMLDHSDDQGWDIEEDDEPTN